jgi:hypothetical protein
MVDNTCFLVAAFLLSTDKLDLCFETELMGCVSNLNVGRLFVIRKRSVG